MKHPKSTWPAILLAAAWAVLAASSAKAQTTNPLVGSWTVVSATTERGETKTETYGPHPKGSLMVDADGRYSIALMRAGLPKIASNNRTTGTAEENKAIVSGSIALFGTLTVNAQEKLILCKVATSTFPNWDEVELRCPFTITGDELRFTIPEATGGGRGIMVWKRVK